MNAAKRKPENAGFFVLVRVSSGWRTEIFIEEREALKQIKKKQLVLNEALRRERKSQNEDRTIVIITDGSMQKRFAIPSKLQGCVFTPQLD